MPNEFAVKAAEAIRKKIKHQPKIGLILGSGLGTFVNEMTEKEQISYEAIPGFPVSTVAGHAGNFVFGKIAGKTIAVMQGRFHLYEGYPLDKVVFPIQVMHRLGVKKLIVTNASGGVNPAFQPGDLMLITDHINNMGATPIRDDHSKSHSHYFNENIHPYSLEIREVAINAAKNIGLHLEMGVYVANSGPTYETPAEVQMIHKMGGDAVGMSTVPEVIAARQAGIQVLGISCISNMAAGISNDRLDHEDVIATTEKVRTIFSELVKTVIQDL